MRNKSIPWNKGLTKETDDRVKNYGLKQRGKFVSIKTRKKISEARKKIIGWKHSEETKEKMSKSASTPRPWMRGNKNPAWRGGITSLVRLIRHTYKYRQWRSDIFTRDDFKCQICGGKGILEAHHIKGFIDILKENNINTLEDAEKCEELWNINNGETLCQKCHLAERK